MREGIVLLIVLIIIVIIGGSMVWMIISGGDKGSNIDQECTPCGNVCVTLEFAAAADCLRTTEEFGCRYDGENCVRVENDGVGGSLCERIESDLQTELQKINYCGVDSDCKNSLFDEGIRARSKAYGCDGFFNDWADLTNLKILDSEYIENECVVWENFCANPIDSSVKCIDNKCERVFENN